MVKALSWVVFGAIGVGGLYAYFNGDALCREATGRGLLESWWRRLRRFVRSSAKRNSGDALTVDSAETVLWV